MEKEEAKHLSEVLNAYSEGKVIQKRSYFPGNDTWGEWKDYTLNITFSGYDALGRREEYRIKPNPLPRPYKNAEFIEAQKKHGQFLRRLPLGTHRAECCHIATYCDNTAVKINDIFWQYDELLKSFVWADDNSICGIIEE